MDPLAPRCGRIRYSRFLICEKPGESPSHLKYNVQEID